MTSARDWIRSRCPEALAAFEQAGAQTLADYAAGFGADAALPRPPQAADDLVELAAATCARLYSPDLGQALRRELESDLHALTANHHGVDFHPEFFQGDLLFAMSCRHAVPLFNCGAVPANNVAYPRGILLGCGTPEEVSFRSRKLPILPGRDRHGLISVRPAFTAAEVTLPSQLSGQPKEPHALDRLVQAVYRHPRVLGQQTFRDQASLMNALLWQQVIPKSCDLPPLVSLDMQWLCGRLITADLEQPDSLVRHLLLHPPLAAAIWDALNGQRACWTGDAQGLQRGTFLFWGVDGKGRALALRPARDFRSLVAVRDAGWRLPLDARTLGRALSEERILPSLFLYFATVTAARGLRCAGGIFQTSYLPRMIQGICTALRHCGADGLATRIAGAFRPCPPCTGLLPLRLPCPDGPLRQTGRGAGAADLWLAGGLSPALWQSLRHSRVDHALAASLPYHYEDLSAQEMRPLLLDSLLQQAPPIGSLPFLAPFPLEMPHA